MSASARSTPDLGTMDPHAGRETLTWYSADQMRAYALQERAAERERWERAIRQAWQLIDPLNPAGTPGSYARGVDSGVTAALSTVLANREA